MSTNLATQISTIFGRFSKAAGSSNQQKPKSIWAAWVETFDSKKKTDEPSTLELISLVERCLARLKREVGGSRILAADAKLEAVRVVEGLSDCVNAQHFHQAAHSFSDRFSKDRLAILSVLGSTLQIEFPEAQLDQDTLSNLSSELERLISEVEAANFEPKLKNLVLRHLSFILYALRNMDIVGAEGVYDAIGKAMVSVQRIPDANEPQPDPEQQNKTGTKAAVKAFCSKVWTGLQIAEKADRSLKALEDFREIAENLLDHL